MGERYDGVDGKGKDKWLAGGKKMPVWTDLRLPFTYTSSHKVMLLECDAVRKGAVLKQKAKEAGSVACVPTEKVRLEPMNAELKRVRESMD